MERGIKGSDRKHIKMKDDYNNQVFNSNDTYEIAKETNKKDKNDFETSLS